MTFDLASVVKESFEGSSKDFDHLAEEAQRFLKRKGKHGNVDVFGRFAQMEPSGDAIVCSDLHGDLDSLIEILEKSKAVQRLSESEQAHLIFLGDFGDRGPFSVEVFWVALSLKVRFPDQILLLRGNHEGPEYLLPVPYDLPAHFRRRFGNDWEKPYKKLRATFDNLFNALVVSERYFMIHGGPPTSCSTETLASAGEGDEQSNELEEILWSDPNEETDRTADSPRGAGRLYGRTVTEEVLRNFDVRIIVRGHESSDEGYKISHNGKVLTLFSRKGPPYFNNQGSYLDVRLEFKPENARQLVPYIHTF